MFQEKGGKYFFFSRLSIFSLTSYFSGRAFPLEWEGDEEIPTPDKKKVVKIPGIKGEFDCLSTPRPPGGDVEIPAEDLAI